MADITATTKEEDAFTRAEGKIAAGAATLELADVGAQWRVVEQERMAAADAELAAMERALATGGKMPSVVQAEERAAQIARTDAEKTKPVVVIENLVDPNSTRMDFLEL